MCLGKFNKLLVGMHTVSKYLIGDLELVSFPSPLCLSPFLNKQLFALSQALRDDLPRVIIEKTILK